MRPAIPSRLAARLPVAALLGLAFGMHFAAVALADTDPARSIEGIEERLRAFIDLHTRDFPGRVEVRFGPPHGRLPSSPCEELEPFVPPGARLWGRANIGVRCVSGPSRWTAYVPLEVRVHMPALVASRQIAAGHAIESGDHQVREVDITREPNGVLIDPAMADSKVAARTILPGTVLRTDLLRERPAISVGDAVKIVYAGPGFNITTTGKALASATIGQAIRVQVESGRIVSGTTREGRIVEVR